MPGRRVDGHRLPSRTVESRPETAFLACVDPRLASLGARALLPKAEAEETLNAAGFARAERDGAEVDVLDYRPVIWRA